MNLEKIQESLSRTSLSGWLFFDHHRRDPLAYRILGIPDTVIATRRWYYFIPAQGEPRKLVHKIESGSLDSVPGNKEQYSSWPDQQEKLKTLLAGHSRIAMQYSPQCAIPYVSMVDAGTIELVRAAGVEPVSSANLVQEFEARWTDEQFSLHIEAGKRVDQVRREAFDLIAQRLRDKQTVTEYDIQQFILRGFSEADMTTDHGPIVAVNANASDPHYEPNLECHHIIQVGDLVLIDMWAKLQKPNAVYYDITWTGYCGASIPDNIQRVFEIARDARKLASDFVIRKVSNTEPLAGFEVDDVARGYINSQQLGEFFFHRTGHNIGTEVHGTGANMDNLESHDDREVISHTCFSIEPGIYLPEFGIRSEVNVYVGEHSAQVTGEEQEALIKIC